MIVTCPNCTTRYNLPDDKVPPGGAKVKCSKCAHVFKAELPPVTPEEEVETLLEEDTPTPDEGAGDAFDETFNEVAGGGDAAASDESSDEPAGEPTDAPTAADDEPAPEPEEDPFEGPTEDELSDLFDDTGDDIVEETAEDELGALFDDAEDDAADDMDVPTEEVPEEDMPGMDDLFDDTDAAPAPDEGPSPTDDTDQAVADDVESLFGDDEDDLFAEEESDDNGVDDLFGDDDDDVEDEEDLFAEDDDAEEKPKDFDEDTDFGLDEEPKEKKKSSKSLGCLIILLVAILALGGAVYFKVWTMFGVDLGSYFKNVPYVGKMFEEEQVSEEAAPGESPADRVRKIELKNVKQYYVANEKTGNLFVVEGKAVNKFTTPKERIKVEVVLYDGAGNVLTSKTFLCGNVLSQFQLQVQTQKEVEDGLASEVGILSNNTFIRPGASTPFMAVFFEPPAGVKEFVVKVVDVGDPE